MNERINVLIEQAGLEYNFDPMAWLKYEKLVELVVQDCADFVRENYDHEAAECIAWNMEIKYGLHGDYA